MARRSGGSARGSGFGRARSPSPSRRAVPPPPPPKAVAPQPAPTQMAQPAMGQAPGLMAQVASTAAGVAIGHTVGHALTSTLMGGGSSDAAHVEAQAPGQQMQQQQPMSGQEPCRFELEQFLNCAQTQSNDLTLCEGFNQVLRECKTRYGQMYHQ